MPVSGVATVGASGLWREWRRPGPGPQKEGDTILGDNIGFWFGREFGEPLLEKWGHLVGLDARKRMLGRYLFAR